MATELASADPAEAIKAELNGLIARVEKGDEKARPLLREALSRVSDVALLGGVWSSPADRAMSLTRGWLAGNNLAAQEVLARHVELFERDLLAGGDSPIERILVRRAAVCWLVGARADASLASVHSRKEPAPFRLLEHYQRAAERADRRLIHALKALALVRRMALPVLVALVPKTAPPVPVVEARTA